MCSSSVWTIRAKRPLFSICKREDNGRRSCRLSDFESRKSNVNQILNYFSVISFNELSWLPSCLLNLVSGLTLTAFDMSGQSKYRSLWERYYADCHGVVFVIDSSDTMRMAVACNELQLMIQHPEMMKNRSTTKGVPILILANKSDLDTAIPIGQVRRKTVVRIISNGATLESVSSFFSQKNRRGLVNRLGCCCCCTIRLLP